jgi:hypothetical protein
MRADSMSINSYLQELADRRHLLIFGRLLRLLFPQLTEIKKTEE